MAAVEHAPMEIVPINDDLKSFLKQSTLFEGFSEDDLDEILTIGRIIEYQRGEIIIEENEITDQIFLIKEGQVGIYKWDEKSEQSLHIATLGIGEVVGELHLLDNIPRSASVHAKTSLIVFEIPILKLRDLPARQGIAARWASKISQFSGLKKQDQTQRESKLYFSMVRNLAKSLSLRVRNANLAVAEALRKELIHAKMRMVMGMFIIAIIAMLSVYVMLLVYVQHHGKDLATPSLVTLPMIGAFAAIVLIYMQKTGFPLRMFGLTLKGWQVSLKESLICTVAFMVFLVGFKWVLIHTVDSFKDHAIFQGNVIDINIAYKYQILLLALYLLFAPLQEFISRGALQSSLQEFLISPRKTFWAILLSNLLFSMTHFIISPAFGVMSFVPGLMWGWLYARHRTLIGVVISHEIIGIWAIFVLGL